MPPGEKRTRCAKGASPVTVPPTGGLQDSWAQHETHQCVGCGAKTPDASTAHTLISEQHGWRLTRRETADGTYVLDWYCRSCWQERRRKADAHAAEPSHAAAAGKKFDSALAALKKPPSRPAR